MRIVIDMQGAQSDFSKHRGVGRHTKELVKAIAANNRSHTIILALNGAFPESIDEIRGEFDSLLPQSHIRVWQQFYSTPAVQSDNAPVIYAAKVIREIFLNTLEPDVIFSTNLQEGLFDSAVTSVRLLPSDALFCSTLHDITPLHYPERYLSDKTVRDWYNEKIGYIKESDIVLTVSHASKNDIIDKLGLPQENVHVVYNSYDREKFNTFPYPETFRSDLLAQYGIVMPFIMYVGGNDVHKNLRSLYTAFAKLPDSLRRSHQLVLVGKELKTEEPIIRRELEKLGISGHVVITGMVDDETLKLFYQITKLFVFPSTNEGFGLPVLEAMACGSAVIGSDASSIPEIIGIPEALFDPLDAEAIARRIEKALTDSDFQRVLRNNATDRLGRFSWDESAKHFLALMEEGVRPVENKKYSYDNPVGLMIDTIAQSTYASSLSDDDLAAIALSAAETFTSRHGRENTLFVDVSAVVVQDDKSGIQRVTRAIAGALLKNDRNLNVEIVYTSVHDHAFYRASKYTEEVFGIKPSDEPDEPIDFIPGDTLLFLDLHPGVAISHRQKTQYMRNKGIRVFHVVYDLLPVQMPGYFWPELCEEFNAWIETLCRSDGAICISRSVASELKAWREEHIPPRLRPFHIGWFHLGADICNSAPSFGLPSDADTLLHTLSGRPSFLMVGTIEPRKGHAQTLSAFERLWDEGMDLNLVMVGREGWKNEAFIQKVQTHPEFGRRLFWLKNISDEYLEKLYAASTALIAASEGEGFGLPLIEAAQHALPVLARDIPVFREVAGENAFYFKAKDPDELAKAVLAWLALYEQKIHPLSDSMCWLTWQESVNQLLDQIIPKESADEHA